MSEFEQSKFIITGEIPPEDWQLALQFLGRIGVRVEPIDATNGVQKDAVSAPESIPRGAIPYQLSEMHSPDQFLSNEHVGEFWPEYRRSADKPGSKNECVGWGINILTHPQPKGIKHPLSEKQSREYARSLQVEKVTPRSSVGFSDEYAPGAYGLWDYKKLGDAVMPVQSFIASVQHIETLPNSERPYGVSAAALRFFLALARKLELQLMKDVT